MNFVFLFLDILIIKIEFINFCKQETLRICSRKEPTVLNVKYKLATILEIFSTLKYTIKIIHSICI